MSALSRRRFLAIGAAGAAGLAFQGPARAFAALGARGAPMPEYAGSLDELLVVFDQSRSLHLMREIVEILRHAPGAKLHVLVSRALEAEARERFAAHGLRDAAFLPSDAGGVSGDWGRDILQVARDPDGTRVVHVPWNKAGRTRAALERGVRELAGLARDDLRVRLLPAAWEGGNLMTDRAADGHGVLFAGSTIAVETTALYRRWYDATIDADEVARLMGEALGCDEVVWIGPRDRAGRLQRQPRLLFHVDMGMTLIAPGVAVVARLDPGARWRVPHRDVLARELAWTRAAVERRRLAGRPEAPLPALPDSGAEAAWLDAAVDAENEALAAAAAHLEHTARILATRGHTVHRVTTGPERARRFQSYTNVIPSRDRLIVPIYPSVERVHGWVVPGPNGRDRVDVDPGIEDSDFDLADANLAAVELYRSLHPGVRVVRDYFYMASGNAHCVIGRLS